MDDKIRKQLTKQERAILADFWESDARKVIEKVMGLKQLQIAQTVLAQSPNHEFTVLSRGKSLMAGELDTFLHENFKAVQRERLKN